MNKHKFYQFVIPSVCASMVTGLYFVVDGIFVGRGGRFKRSWRH